MNVSACNTVFDEYLPFNMKWFLISKQANPWCYVDDCYEYEDRLCGCFYLYILYIAYTYYSLYIFYVVYDLLNLYAEIYWWDERY